MKKLFSLIVISMLVMTVHSQQKAFVSIGTSISTGKTTNCASLGLATTDYDCSLLVEVVNSKDWYGGVKYSRQFFKSVNPIKFYGFGAIKANLQSPNNIVFEPGVSVGVTLFRKLGLKVSASSPINEGVDLFKPVRLKAGTSLSLLL